MSISLETSRVDFVGNGTQDTFTYTFKVFLEDDLRVIVREVSSGTETVLVKTTDYTITGVGETSGGTIVLVDSGQAWIDGDGDLDTGYVLTIRRVPDIVQATDIRNQGAYFPETIEDQLDKQVHIDQKQQDEIDRSLRMPESLPTSSFDPELPAGMAVADVSLVTNSAGDGFAVGPTTDEIANAQAYAIDAGEHRDTAKDWATKLDGSVVDYDTAVDSNEYSAEAYALGGVGVTDTATKGAAKEWAVKTSGTVDTSEYSSKEYAQGIQAGTGGSAKDWAIETASDVDSSGEYSSKEHAQGIQTRGASGGGSAKDWAQYTGGTVDDIEFSAKKYAADAASSAADAATTAAASLWSDVVFKAFGDSPIAIVDGDAGKMIAIDCSGGNVVVNLPSISGLTLTGPWSVGIKKTDTSSNTITINENGSDEIDGAAGPLVITRPQAGTTLIPDEDPTPDSWTSITYGEVPIAGAIVGDSDTQTLTNKTIDGDNNTITNLAHGAEVDNPSSGVHGVTGSVVGTTDVQDLSGKTFTDAITLEELGSTPSTPASGDKKFYAKNDGKVYTLNDSGEEVEVGAGGGGSGGINYILNPDAETNTDGWTVYDDGAVAAPIDGVGGTATLTFTRETGSPLRGDGSFRLASGGATNKQGQGVTYGFTIDPADRGKTLTISFDYLVSSNYASGDIRIFVYDVTNATLIPVTHDDDGDVAAHSLASSKFAATFQTSTGSTSYRLIYHIASTSALTYNMDFDNVKVGPDTLVPGAIITEWESFTPTTSLSTNVNFFGKKRRVGDSLECLVEARFTGANTESTYEIVIPDGLSIDTAKLNTTSGELESLGRFIAVDASSGRTIGETIYNSATGVRARIIDESSGSTHILQSVSTATSVPFTVAVNDRYLSYFTVPIVGWSAGASLSTTETIFSTAKARYTTDTATLIDNDSFDVVDFEDVDFDPFSSVTTGSSWNYLAPRSGYYQVNGNITYAATNTWNAGEQGVLAIFVNGSIFSELGRVEIDPTVTQTFNLSVGGADIVYLNKGDLLDLRAFHNSGAALNLNGVGNQNRVSIAELPDFSTFSVYGQQETFEIEPTANTTTTTANTYLAVTGSSLVLGPGKYLVGYTTLFFINNASGGTAGVSGNIRLTQDGALVPGSISSARSSSMPAGSAIYFPVYKETELILTTTKTIEAEIRCDQSSASGVVRWIGNGNFDGVLTDPDCDSKVWARRIS